MTADCVTLWIGDRLGPVERACMRSVLRQGHSLALYCYAAPAGVPEGVVLRDAAGILPQRSLEAPWCARADLYSDWFRYELQRRGLGTWIDTDIYLVGRIDLERPYLFGLQEPGIINNAVLRLPSDSPLLPPLLKPFERQTTPGWLPWHLYWPMRIREKLAGGADLTRTPWGTTAPHAVSALAPKHGLDRWAEPPERFYPVPWQQADWIVDPARRLEDMITNGTIAVHLWNERIKSLKNSPAPEGSFLHRLQQEGR